MKWLISSFAPFNNAATNSSLIVMNALSEMNWQGSVKFYGPLPVLFNQSWQHLEEQISPDIDGVLVLGQAESRQKIALECVALNWIDTNLSDNSGYRPERGQIIAEAPDVNWTSIPWEKLEPSSLSLRSYSAGTFVCNEVMYHLLRWSRSRQKLAGFVHIPVLHSQSEFHHVTRLRDQDAISEVARIVKFLLTL